MQQKYLHQHRLSNNLINNKLRQQMYLKHLRQVEKINNRDTQNLKKQIKHNLSIAQIHKNNKVKAYQFKLRQNLKILEDRNIKIYGKITSIGDYDMGGRHKKAHSHSLNLTNDSQSKEKLVESSEKKKYDKPSFHYRYRKRQQQHIELENAKLMKAILSQRKHNRTSSASKLKNKLRQIPHKK